jgi:hypothetical protein
MWSREPGQRGGEGMSETESGQATDRTVVQFLTDWDGISYEDKRKRARMELQKSCDTTFLAKWDQLPISGESLFKFFTKLAKGKIEGFRSEWERVIILRPQVRAKIAEIGVPDSALQEWDGLEISSATLGDFVIPTQEQVEAWSKLPKDYDALRQIRHPILCRWTKEDVIEAMVPTVGEIDSPIAKIINKYHTTLSPKDDCGQNARIGVLLALRTDQGRSPFASHAFNRARTAVRRASATSGVMKRAEKRPSRTEAKIAIGVWLSGNWEEEERERLAREISIKCWHWVTIDDKLGVLGTVWHSRCRKYQNYEKLTPELKKKVAETAKQNFRALVKPRLRTINLPSGEKVNIVEQVPVNLQCLTTPDDYILCRVQRTGVPNPNEDQFRILAEIYEYTKNISKKLSVKQLASGIHLTEEKVEDALRFAGATMPLIKESFQLSRLDPNTLTELMEYLNCKFNCSQGKAIFRNSILSVFGLSGAEPDTTKYQSVEDLIKLVAANPDFHSNPTAWDVQLEDGYSVGATLADEGSPDPVQVCINQDSKTRSRDLVLALRAKITLTLEQETVMVESYGLDGTTEKTGSYIANSFGELVRLHVIRKFLAEKVSIGSISLEARDWLMDIGPVYPKDAAAQVVKRTKVQAPHLTDEAQKILGAASPNEKVSRQRLTQFLEAINHKLLDAAFEFVFMQRSDPGDKIKVAMQSVARSRTPLAPHQVELATLLFGLDMPKPYTMDEVIVDLDAVLEDEELLSRIDSRSKTENVLPSRREFVKEELWKIKQSLLDAII